MSIIKRLQTHSQSLQFFSESVKILQEKFIREDSKSLFKGKDIFEIALFKSSVFHSTVRAYFAGNLSPLKQNQKT